jgi:hypothetical protein
MNIGEGYRWNVPVVTYAFDQSFLGYFGSNGVAQVEAAIQVLNDLPQASAIVLTNFPVQTWGMNYRANFAGISQLEMSTLPVLFQELGLGEAVRNIFDLSRWDSTFQGTNLLAYGFYRNFDPETLQPTIAVNGEGYQQYVLLGYPTSNDVRILEQPFDPTISDENPYDPVADQLTTSWYSYWKPGKLFTSLTRDDVGGLRYLLGTNTVNLETLLSDVHGTGTNWNNYVNLALRPGIEKVTFVRQQYDSVLGQAVPFTNQFVDTYISNGLAMHQQLERVVAQPDFLFSVAVTGPLSSSSPVIDHSGTSNWWNSATVTGTGASGPGVIRPPVRITFNNPGAVVETSGAAPASTPVNQSSWGSFDDSTNAPVAYPVGSFTGTYPLTVNFSLYASGQDVQPKANLAWQVPLGVGATANLQVSSNLVNWATVATVTNRGATVTWRHDGIAAPSQFFRVAP